MNGGMGKRSNPYAARLIDRHRTGTPSTPVPPTVEDVPELPPPDVKHVWVTDEHGRRAGLLLRWERCATGWVGRVTYAAPYEDGWALVEEWLPAETLEPVIES